MFKVGETVVIESFRHKFTCEANVVAVGKHSCIVRLFDNVIEEHMTEKIKPITEVSPEAVRCLLLQVDQLQRRVGLLHDGTTNLAREVRQHKVIFDSPLNGFETANRGLLKAFFQFMIRSAVGWILLNNDRYIQYC